MRKGILFDLDGTLLDSLADLHRCTNHVLALYGCPPRTLAEIRRFVGNGARNLIAQSLPGLDSDPDVDQVLATYHSYYHANCKGSTCPYPGILEALSVLKEKYPIAIVSNKPTMRWWHCAGNFLAMCMPWASSLTVPGSLSRICSARLWRPLG